MQRFCSGLSAVLSFMAGALLIGGLLLGGGAGFAAAQVTAPAPMCNVSPCVLPGGGDFCAGTTGCYIPVGETNCEGDCSNLIACCKDCNCSNKPGGGCQCKS